MRSSILTELLEVSHIRSIRQIFISILVILVLQVAITDLFENGTSVKRKNVEEKRIFFRFFFSVDFRFDVIRWNFSNFSACIRVWLLMFGSTCSIVYYSFHFWAYKRLSLISLYSTTTTEKTKKKATSLCKSNENFSFLHDDFSFRLFSLFSIGFVFSLIVVTSRFFFIFLFITFSKKIIRSLRE